VPVVLIQNIAAHNDCPVSIDSGSLVPVHCLTLAADKYYYPAAQRVHQPSDGVRMTDHACYKPISVTGLTERLESPVVVRGRGHKTCCKHDRQYPPG